VQTVQQRLADVVGPLADRSTVRDVRIGLGYTAVQLDTGSAGVAWTPPEASTTCTHFSAAGTLSGSSARRLLDMLTEGKSGLAGALGLATANALLAAMPMEDAIREDSIDSLGITPGDRVVMVGYFGPIIAGLKKTGCRLDILELDPERGEGALSPQQGKDAMAGCTVAIITGTTLINHTFDEVTGALGNPRAALLLGPSSPLCGKAFRETKITHVAGSRVINPESVLRIVSEGGGTMIMKKHLEFATVRTRTD
jgi:uncharacterized protein